MASRVDSPNTAADHAIRELIAGTPQSFVVKAGAGSGKTTSLVKALASVEQYHGARMRSNQQQVACITYTELAAAEIFSEVKESPLFHVSTIHSFLWSIVSPFQRDLHQWVTARVEEKIPSARQKLERARTARTTEQHSRSLENALADKAALPRIKRFGYQTASRFREGFIGHSDVIVVGPELIRAKSLLADIVAQRYPFIFVDESQDTFESVVDALSEIEGRSRGSVCVGYFGDPMQQIYPTGVGEIRTDGSWQHVTKPENFRCPTKVLDVINAIRRPIDSESIQETGRYREEDDSRTPIEGSADIFVLPADSNKTSNLWKVRDWLATKYSDPKWIEEEASSRERKTLVIEHRLAAGRLGFPQLFDAFSGSSNSIELDFREGNAWPTRIFQDYLLPLMRAQGCGDHRGVMQLIRRFAGPQLTARLAGDDPAQELSKLKAAVVTLAAMGDPESGATVRDALELAAEENLAVLDERLTEVMAGSRAQEGEEGDDVVDGDKYLYKYLNVPLIELLPYKRYVEGETGYATQQGVKGAEFERVLVVLDDQDSRHFQFSYDKLFGLKGLSDKDRENIDSGQDDVLSRTRRLLYVCCSRAREALAVVFYATSPQEAQRNILADGPFAHDSVHLLEELAVADGDGSTDDAGQTGELTLF